MVEALTNNLLQDERVNHGFFTKKGGVSTGLYDSLNCGVGSKDELQSVMENRRRVAVYFDAPPGHLLTLNQIHSNICLYVDAPYDAINNRPQADALVTDQPGLAIGILTADCGPVLFYGRSRDGQPIIGAAHAGWGGALKGILENTVAAMEKCGLDKSTLKAVLGPCIGALSYEVSEDFRDPFIMQDMKNARFFLPAARAGYLMFNLPAYIERRLFLAGVPQIAVMGRDTCAEADAFFSYRRSTHHRESDYGRQISVIQIRKIP